MLKMFNNIKKLTLSFKDELNASELIHKIPLPKLQLLTIKKRSESYEQFIFN